MEPSPLVKRMFEHAQKVGDLGAETPETILSSWLAREAHLAVMRAHDYAVNGIPEENAWFLATDDVGFQLANAFLASSA
jgi:hypothetical protein